MILILTSEVPAYHRLQHMVSLLKYCHCKNKLIVLTTEWSLWLQTNWRDMIVRGLLLALKT